MPGAQRPPCGSAAGSTAVAVPTRLSMVTSRGSCSSVAHDSLLVAVVAVPPRRVPKEVVRITGAERAHHDVVQRRRVLGDAELAKSARRNVQLAHRLTALREQRPLKGRVDPRPGRPPGPP